jgi:hypothetical protein
VKCIKGFLWQKASTGRFGSSVGACFVLATHIEGRPVYLRLLDFFDAFPVLLDTSKRKRDIVSCFRDELECRRIEYLAQLFVSAIYPILRAFGEVAKKETIDITFEWQEQFFLSVSHALSTVAKKLPILSRINDGLCDAFRNPILCSVDPTTCTFRTERSGHLPTVRRITSDAVLAVLPAEVRTHGLDQPQSLPHPKKTARAVQP